MKVLLAYHFNSRRVGEFFNAQRFQPRFPLPDYVERLVVTSPWSSSMKSDWKSSEHLIIDPTLEYGGVQVKGRNRAIEFASLLDFDWLVLLDGDAVITDFRLPEKLKYGTCEVELLPRDGVPGDTYGPKVSGWFVLHRDIFSKPWCRFFDGFNSSHGWQDMDFAWNVVGRNMHVESFDGVFGEISIKAAHVWHPKPSETDPDFRTEFNRMKALYDSRHDTNFVFPH
jgi:hypothetical protein